VDNFLITPDENACMGRVMELTWVDYFFDLQY
jgi:hypothetical protein